MQQIELIKANENILKEYFQMIHPELCGNEEAFFSNFEDWMQTKTPDELEHIITTKWQVELDVDKYNQENFR